MEETKLMQKQRRELEALKTKATALRDEALVSQVCGALTALGGWDHFPWLVF